MLLGLFNFPPELAPDWPIAVTRTSYRNLAVSRTEGLSVLLALTGNRSSFSDRNGCFDLAMWKGQIDRHDAAFIRDYVDSGTIVGLYAIDEPHDWPCGPSIEDIDAACAYALSKWPGLRCGVNAPPAWLRPGLGRLDHLGFILVQYSQRQGEVDAWLRKQMDDAAWFQGELWFSIQFFDPRLSMSQLVEIGAKFCAVRPRGVMLWKWTADRQSDRGFRDAVGRIAEACREARGPAN